MKCSIATIGRSRGEQPRNFVYPMMKSALNPPCRSSMYRQYLWRRSQKGEEETSPGQGPERENCSFGETFEPKYQLEGARAWDMIFGAARLLIEEDEPIRVERLGCVGDAIGLFGRPSAFEFLQRSRLFPV
jgi:hypothetical protein